MICKANFVPTVKEIMPRQATLYAWFELSIAILLCGSGAHKDLDRTLNRDIIIFTVQGRHSGDLVNAQHGGKKSKRDTLKHYGTLNPHPYAVTAPLFEAG